MCTRKSKPEARLAGTEEITHENRDLKRESCFGRAGCLQEKRNHQPTYPSRADHMRRKNRISGRRTGELGKGHCVAAGNTTAGKMDWRPARAGRAERARDLPPRRASGGLNRNRSRRTNFERERPNYCRGNLPAEKKKQQKNRRLTLMAAEKRDPTGALRETGWRRTQDSARESNPTSALHEIR
jgi:hypothetical protein